MERKSVLAFIAAFALAGVCLAQDKKDTGGGDGPYGLPPLAAVKEKVKLTEDEAKKVGEIYATASKNEQESKVRAKENGTDRKTLEGYMTIGRNDTVNKIKEVLDKDKGSAFDKLVASQPPPDKKKKK
jgi:hypothetical protein